MTSTRTGLFPPGLTHSAGAWDATWSDALGAHWRLFLALLGVLLFLTGFWFPLADPDLGMHLATGEWIVRRGEFAMVEPFAWTRPGAPFLAYSWLPEVVYFLLIDRVGAASLHVLHGLSLTAVAWSIVVLGRAFGWSAWAILITAICHMMAALAVAAYLRPQLILFVLIPLVWALVYRSRDAERMGWILAALVALSAVAANTHLLFPLLGAPCVLLLTHPPAQRSRIIAVPAAIAGGWVLTPYLFELPEMFRLYFGPNALLGPPSAIEEYRPGFEMLLEFQEIALVLVVVCAVLPWIAGGRMTASERLWHGLPWLAGLILYALAVRALAAWWLVVLPIVGTAISMLPDPVVPAVRLAQRGIIIGIAVLFAGQAWEQGADPFLADGSASVRTLPSGAGRGVEPLVRWLDCQLVSRPATRLLTVHNFGSYLVWRTPWLSESIDGRTFFPDSVTQGEGYLRLPARELKLPPWRSAEVAIVPSHYLVAAVLDTASNWHRVAVVAGPTGRVNTIGLWVQTDWWNRHAIEPLPTRPVMLNRRLPVAAPGCDRPPIERVVRGPGSFDALVGSGVAVPQS